MNDTLLKSGNKILKSGNTVLVSSNTAKPPIWRLDPGAWDYTHGQSVPTIYDSSSNGLNGSQSDPTKQGVFKTNIINGLPVLELGGVNDYYMLPQLLTAGTIFIVIKAASPTSGGPVFGNSSQSWQWTGNIGSANSWFAYNSSVNNTTSFALGPYNRVYINNAATPILPTDAVKSENFMLLTLDVITNSKINLIGTDYREGAGFEYFLPAQYAYVEVYDYRMQVAHRDAKRNEILTKFNL